MKNINNVKKEHIINGVVVNGITDSNGDNELFRKNLWKQLEQTKETTKLTFIIMGHLLYSLKNEYASHKTGSFQNEYVKRGFKKTQVQTLIAKYLIYKEHIGEDYIGRDATDINKTLIIIEESSQKTIAAFKKLSPEKQEQFLQGDISSDEVREMAEEIKKAKAKSPKRVLPALKSIEKLGDKTLKLKPQDYHIAYTEIQASEQILLSRKNELLEKMKEAGIEVPQ